MRRDDDSSSIACKYVLYVYNSVRPCRHHSRRQKRRGPEVAYGEVDYELDDDEESLSTAFNAFEMTVVHVCIICCAYICEDFKVRVVQEAASVARGGDISFSYEAFARGEAAVAFVRARCIMLTFFADMSLYDAVPAATLSEALCHRMQYFLNIFFL